MSICYRNSAAGRFLNSCSWRAGSPQHDCYLENVCKDSSHDLHSFCCQRWFYQCTCTILWEHPAAHSSTAAHLCIAVGHFCIPVASSTGVRSFGLHFLPVSHVGFIKYHYILLLLFLLCDTWHTLNVSFQTEDLFRGLFHTFSSRLRRKETASIQCTSATWKYTTRLRMTCWIPPEILRTWKTCLACQSWRTKEANMFFTIYLCTGKHPHDVYGSWSLDVGFLVCSKSCLNEFFIAGLHSTYFMNLVLKTPIPLEIQNGNVLDAMVTIMWCYYYEY